jgi:acetoacetate decarboxylase
MTTSTVETKPAIEAGLTGTLSPQEYTTKTTPSWGETYRPAMASYADMDYVSIAFATDADKAAALIPKELQLIKISALPGQAVANLVFAKYRECDLGPYMEVIISISVLHKGQAYGYIPAIYVDNDAALLAGRELGGYPKKDGSDHDAQLWQSVPEPDVPRLNTGQDRRSQLQRSRLVQRH